MLSYPDGIADEVAQEFPVFDLSRENGGVWSGGAGRRLDGQVWGPEHGGTAIFGVKQRCAVLRFKESVDQVGGAQEVGDEAVDWLIVEFDR